MAVLWVLTLGLVGLGVMVMLGAAMGWGGERQRTTKSVPRPFVPRPAAMPLTAEPFVPSPPPVSTSRGATPPRDPDFVVAPAPEIDRRSLGIGMAITVGLALVILAVAVLVGGRPAIGGAVATPTPARVVIASVATTIAPPIPTLTLPPVGPLMVTVDVPVIACATSYANGDVQRPTEASERLTIPTQAVGRLAVFATNGVRVLAPRWFRCTADVGGNSTAILTVTQSFDPEAKVIVEDAAVSFGYILELACPLFPAAAKIDKQEFGEICEKPPAAEIVIHQGKTVARFEDPPGIAGTGTGSGGPYAAVGAIWYASESAVKVTCALPPEDQDLCRIVTDDLLRRLVDAATP